MIWNRATTSNGVYNSYYTSQLQIIAVKDMASLDFFKFFSGFITLWGGDGVMLYTHKYQQNLYQQNLYQQNLFLLSYVQAYTQKNNSSYVSIKEQRGDQSDTYLPS